MSSLLNSIGSNGCCSAIYNKGANAVSWVRSTRLYSLASRVCSAVSNFACKAANFVKDGVVKGFSYAKHGASTHPYIALGALALVVLGLGYAAYRQYGG